MEAAEGLTAAAVPWMGVTGIGLFACAKGLEKLDTAQKADGVALLVLGATTAILGAYCWNQANASAVPTMSPPPVEEFQVPEEPVVEPVNTVKSAKVFFKYGLPWFNNKDYGWGRCYKIFPCVVQRA